MDEAFTWSVDSALYQVEYGELGTDRTYSAANYLQTVIQEGRAGARLAALNLLAMVERGRIRERAAQ